MDPEKYISDVTSKKIKTNKWVSLSVKRHLFDLKNLTDKGYYFDNKAGMAAVNFFPLLKHYKGEYAGKSFTLLDWQAFIVYMIFGWKKDDGKRRFRYVYIKVSRKNGKTTFSAGLCLFGLALDKEKGAEVYTCATKKDQANIAFLDARRMVSNNFYLKQLIDVKQHNLNVKSSDSKMQSVSSDSNTLDGLNPHIALIDEYHAHKNDDLYNVMKSGMGSRTQPLLLCITTAGFNKQGPCYRLEKTCQQILEGIKKDESQFAIMYGLDEKDDYEDESCWIKANPSLGTSLKHEYLKSEVVQAKNNPTQLSNLLTKNFNTWTDASVTWIEDKKFMECKEDFEMSSLIGLKCFGGLDLAANKDLNAFSLLFLDEEKGKYYVKNWYWVPEDTMNERVKRDGVRYDIWKKEGHLKTVDGNATDYNILSAEINKICQIYKPECIAYDDWNSNQTVINLTNFQLNMSPYRQGWKSMSPPSKTLEIWILKKNLIHNGDPILRWMLSNVEILKDPSGNIKPDKAKSHEKIDGVVSLVMAIGIMLTIYGEMANIGPSIYEQETLTTV